MAIFQYGKKEINHLRSRCPILGDAIDIVGPIRREIRPDLFAALVQSIVSQQISSKACVTIWGRIEERFAPITPEIIAVTPVETIQQCGISTRKATYIREAAQSICRGVINIDRLGSLSDDEVCTELARLKGIGNWTAEMLLIFSMQRPNVFSWGDLAIHRGLRMLYRHRVVTEKLFEKYRRRFSPYASVASLYIWAIAGGEYDGFDDPVAKKSKK